MSLKVRKTKTMGRGVFTTEDIKRGRVVETCPCIVWDRQDERQIQSTLLRFYVFEGKVFSDASVLALGFGSLYNHSGKPNATYKYDPKKRVMTIRAIKNIKAGEQIFINYGYDPLRTFQQWEESRARAQ